MRLFFGQLKNILLLKREHVCQLLFRSMRVDNGIIMIYLKTSYCIRTMQFHIVVSISNKRVDAQTKEVSSWSMSNLTTECVFVKNMSCCSQ